MHSEFMLRWLRWCCPSKVVPEGSNPLLFLKKAVFAATLCLSLGQVCEASPWPREQGRVFIESRTDFFRSDNGTDVFERIDTSLYGEWGILPDTMLGGKIVYGSSQSQSPGFAFSADGIVEAEGFVQTTLTEANWGITSLRFAASRPSGLTGGARPGLQADGIDFDVRSLVGIPIFNAERINGFAALESAYRFRTGAAADQVRLDATVGINYDQKLLALLEVQNTLSVRNETPGGADFDIVKIQPSLVWRFSPSLSVRAGGLFEIAGRNLSLGRGAFIALWTEF
ncbi:MAG: hypothetical protein AAF668_15055 [Pseudomonadota bacterium]